MAAAARVFMTGATGFVGSHVARRLVARGHEVHALMLEGDAEDALAKERLGEAHASIAAVRGDLPDPASYASKLEAIRPDACLHLGWYANPKDYLSSRINVDLLGASAALGAKCVDMGVRRLVVAGTCFEYDTSLGFLSETSALAPRHLYSTCKRALGEILAHLVTGKATSLAWARLFFLYGPHEARGRLVPAVIDALLAGEDARVSTGEQIRDFMHVADAAAGLVHVLESDSLMGPVNVASGTPVRVREIVQTIARLVGKEDRIAWGAVTPRPEDPPFVCADVRKLKGAGFSPEHDLASGLADTVMWSKREQASGGKQKGSEK